MNKPTKVEVQYYINIVACILNVFRCKIKLLWSRVLFISDLWNCYVKLLIFSPINCISFFVIYTRNYFLNQTFLSSILNEVKFISQISFSLTTTGKQGEQDNSFILFPCTEDLTRITKWKFWHHVEIIPSEQSLYCRSKVISKYWSFIFNDYLDKICSCLH